MSFPIVSAYTAPLVLILHCLCYPVASAGYSNEIGKPLVVLSAPSLWDVFYREKFYDLINFDIDTASGILGKDNVIVLADRYTIPFLLGRSHEVRKRLPQDVVLEADIYDIFLRNFAPMGVRETVKFRYSPDGVDPYAATQIDRSMLRFLKDNRLKYDKNSTIILQGSDVIDNGRNKAIVNKKAYAQNIEKFQEWVMTSQLTNTFKAVAPLEWFNDTNPLGDNETEIRMDDWLAFVDDDMLAYSSPMHPDNFDILKQAVKKAFREEVKLVDIPSHFTEETWKNRTGVCGVYTGLVRTDQFVYMPVFGNDPDNWLMGQSTMMDKLALETAQVNTRRQVIPIKMPRKICHMGASLRSLTWVVRGKMADQLVELARKGADDRFKEQHPTPKQADSKGIVEVMKHPFYGFGPSYERFTIYEFASITDPCLRVLLAGIPTPPGFTNTYSRTYHH